MMQQGISLECIEMNTTDRGLLACISIALLSVLLKMHLLALDVTSHTNLVFDPANIILSIALALSLIGIIWFGFFHDLIFSKERNE